MHEILNLNDDVLTSGIFTKYLCKYSSLWGRALPNSLQSLFWSRIHSDWPPFWWVFPAIYLQKFKREVRTYDESWCRPSRKHDSQIPLSRTFYCIRFLDDFWVIFFSAVLRSPSIDRTPQRSHGVVECDGGEGTWQSVWISSAKGVSM